MFDSQIRVGSSSKPCKRYITSSSLCRSDPTIGETVVVIPAFIMWMDGAEARSFTPYFPPCRMISGSSRCSSSIVGITMP